MRMPWKESQMDTSAFNYFIWDLLNNISIYQSIKIVYDKSLDLLTRGISVLKEVPTVYLAIHIAFT